MTRAAAALALALFAAAPAAAQSVSSTLSGTVRGPDGTPVAGARVQLRQDATGIVRSGMTDAEGKYRIDGLAPGPWTVVVRGPEGTTGAPRTLTLGLQEKAREDFVVGAILTEQVEVRGEAPPVDPQKTGSALSVLSGQIDALPVNGRSATDLALLDSTVFATPPGNFYGERGSVFVINGQSGRSNSFLVDGLDNNDQSSGTTQNAFFSQLVIGEFTVQTHQYAAEFGRASGGVLNLVTRQGGNEMAGEAFVQGAAAGWNAPGDFVKGLPYRGEDTDTIGRLQTGFRIGGPFVKDRAFYFAAYEHQSSDEIVPFTGTARDGIDGGFMIAPQQDDNILVRTDFNLTPSQFLMVRASYDRRSGTGLNVGGSASPEFGFGLDEKDLQLAGSLTTVVSDQTLNELRLLVGRSDFDQQANSGRPGVEHPSGSWGGNNLNSQIRTEERLQLVDNVTWTRGAHTAKVGIDLQRSHTRIATKFNPLGNLQYDTDAPFEPGDCGDLTAFMVYQDYNGDGTVGNDPVPCPGNPGVDDDGDGVIDEPGLPQTYPFVYQLILGKPHATLNDTRLALFAQDGWQASPRWFFDYGIRYDLSTFVLPADTRVDSSIPNGGADRDLDNVSPRAGFSWSPRGDGRFVVKGGAGVFYDKIVLGFPAVASITSGTEIGFFPARGFTVELTDALIEELGRSFLKHALFYPDELILRFSTGTRLDTPYTAQYSLGFESAITSRQSVSARAVRALGYQMPIMRDLNPVVSSDVFGIPIHRDPASGSIAAIITEGRSWYSGFDLAWTLRTAAGWASASYTWSHALDTGFDPLRGGISLPSDSDHMGDEKGRSDSDRRHRVVLSGDTPLPWFGLRLSGVAQLATGLAFNVTTGHDENLDGITTDRPAGVGRNSGAKTPLDTVNRLRAEENETRTLLGLPPLDEIHSLDEPDYARVDLRLYRPFRFREGRGTGEVSLQVVNALDRFNGGPIEGRVTSQNFGQAVGQLGPPRTFELGLRLGF